MQRISVHISDETRQRIDLAVKVKNKIEAELLRETIDAGLDIVAPKFNSARALLKLAKMAEKLPSKPGEPTDISSDTAKYAFGGYDE